VGVGCSQAEASGSGHSLAPRIPTEWGVSECDRYILLLAKVEHNDALYMRTY
jgi:hypothetical protein